MNSRPCFTLGPLMGAGMLSILACSSSPTEPLATPTAIVNRPAETPYRFETRRGESVSAFRGKFTVPENRGNPQSRTLDIQYVRFAATTSRPGPPIVYLAGGPGGSGVATARGSRFPLFMALRAFGDVIALDQRGTGWSAAAPDCPVEAPPLDKNVSNADALAALRTGLETCRRFWKDRNFDVGGYTTAENALDLDALRQHLGVDKITLWGISYGTHLALAAVKALGSRIDRLVLASAEGLDQTVKLPSRTDAYFGRLQAAINRQPRAKAMFPDIKQMMRAVHAELEAAPVMLELPGEPSQQRILLTKKLLQTLASASIADPRGAARLLLMYGAVAARQYAPIAAVAAKYKPYLWPSAIPIMPVAMDIASGIGARRLEQVEQESKTALLGDLLNYPMPQLNGALGLDLGDNFRTPPRGDVPTLLLSGTLDGRTYPQSQREAVAALSNVIHVTVENAGHNLFMVAPEITAIIERFMRNELNGDVTIKVDPPAFTPGP